jgi:threonyl-tRNA synthetase
VRADGDFDSCQVSEKIAKAESLRIPYMIVIGDKEEEKNTLAVRKRGEKKPEFGIKKEKFISELLEEIKERK